MRTEEFIGKIEELGFSSIKQTEPDYHYCIRDSDKNVLGIVSGEKEGQLSNYRYSFDSLDCEKRVALIKLMVEFSITPIRERKEEEYYLEWTYRGIKSINSTGEALFLNYNIYYCKYTLEIYNEETFGFKTKFTDKEIKNMPDDIKNLIYNDYLTKEIVDEE